MKTEGKASVQPVYTRESCHPSLIGSSKNNKEILTTWHHRPAQRLRNTAAHPPPGHKLLCADATDHAFAASAWHTTRRCCCRYSVRGFNCSGANVSGCAAVTPFRGQRLQNIGIILKCHICKVSELGPRHPFPWPTPSKHWYNPKMSYLQS